MQQQSASRKKLLRFVALFSSLFSVCLLCLFAGTHVVSAQIQYTPMTNLPVSLTGTSSIPELINTLYLLLIGVSTTYGIIKIAIAGVKYTISDVVTSKSEALSDIKGVLIGLAILLIPAIVLNTIYAPLTNLSVLQNIRPVDTGFIDRRIQLDTSLICPDGKRPKLLSGSTWSCEDSCAQPLKTCDPIHIVDSGILLDLNSRDDVGNCLDSGGFTKKHGHSQQGKFTCISQPNKPDQCPISDLECEELCAIAGGTITTLTKDGNHRRCK